MNVLPPDYVAYMQRHGPTEGELSIEPGWYQLWPFDQLAKLNIAYGVATFAPSHFGFGSSGGGEMLAFNAEGKVVMIPFIGMADEEAIVLGDTWADFERAMVESPD